MSHTIDETDREWTRRQVEEYEKRLPSYLLFAKVLGQVLEKAAGKYAPLAIIQTRPKSIASFAEKCQRKKAKYREPVNQITDLCGARVIVHTADEVRAVSTFIERSFQVDQENSVDVSQRLKPAEFGYRSVHYIVSFKPGVFPTRDVNVDIPEVLLDDETFPNRRAEVQVRTILEHAWADIAHDRTYKSSFRIPEKWEREFASVAAALESADRSFSRILEGLGVYAASYGAYMTEEQMREELALLEIVLAYDPGNTGLAGRIGKLAITLGDWPKAIDVLGRHAESGEPAILRDLGVALCKLHQDDRDSPQYREGRRYLEIACQPPHEDVDALSSLAGTWKGIDDDKVHKLYRQAFLLDPTDPYPLENYLDMEIALARDTSIVSLLSPVITAALRRCQAQADVGVNLPWALFMMGKFNLLLGQPRESLDSYAKGVQLSLSPWMIDSALGSLSRLKKAAGQLAGYEPARRLLLIGRTVAARRKAGEAKGDEATKLASREGAPLESPVRIVAGGCDPSIEPQMKAYRDLLLEAFRDFRGTVIGGGTREGISGLVGELGKAYRGAVRTIGYLPKLIPADATRDERYTEIRMTDGSGFSSLEPLQNWIDIVASGLDPSGVRLLGINGGPIAALEYRIALALGATVGVVAESGREGAKLARDEKWGSSKKLVILPADAKTLRAFIGSEADRLPAEIRDLLAREIHEEYRSMKLGGLRSEDPAIADWEKLPGDLRESNAQQADHIFWKLREINCICEKVTGRAPVLLEFTREEVDLLAEIEHGRWNAERLLAGWTWGEKKDLAKKTSPYITSWAALPENIKELDRETVRKIPAFLAKLGLEVRRRP
jgi:ppGpp synthetase/RelA/SpoT-type nucleotidyltranferase